MTAVAGEARLYTNVLHKMLAPINFGRKSHSIISQAGRNDMLISFIEHMWQIRNKAPQVFHAYKSMCEIDGAHHVEEHKEIDEALRNRDPKAARTTMHRHFSRILNELIGTTEAEQVEQARMQAQQVRERFSLNHLVSND